MPCEAGGPEHAFPAKSKLAEFLGCVGGRRRRLEFRRHLPGPLMIQLADRAAKAFVAYQPEIVATIIATTAIPLAAGWVPPNFVYGFRTPRTMASPEAWYAANQLMGYFMLVGQAAAIVFKGAVVQALQSRFGWEPIAWGVLWVCVVALASIAACAAYISLSD